MAEDVETLWKLDIRSECLAIYPANEDYNCFVGMGSNFIHYRHRKLYDDNGEFISWGITDQDILIAKQMVREHNAHAPMVAMIEKSITMMCRRCPGGENCTSATDCNTVKELKETLALAKGE